jgi:tetratricopeptide (TPR) repeat protein
MAFELNQLSTWLHSTNPVEMIERTAAAKELFWPIIVAIIGASYATYQRRHYTRRFKKSERLNQIITERIADERAVLQNDLDYQKSLVTQLALEIDELNTQRQKIGKRLPEAAMRMYRLHRRNGQSPVADDILIDWFAHEGEAISQLLLQRAESIFYSVYGENLREHGLSAAQSFAHAALVFWTENKEAKRFFDELNAWRQSEGLPDIAVVEALKAAMDEQLPLVPFSAASIEDGLGAIKEANALRDAGLFHLASLRIESAIAMLTSQISSTALPTLKARHVRARILKSRGLYAEALFEEQELEPLWAANSAAIERDENALDNFRIQAECLIALGRHTEAFEKISMVYEISGMTLDADDEFALSVHHTKAEILHRLEKTSEALALLEHVLPKRINREGAHSLNVMASQHLYARVLSSAGQLEKALELIRANCAFYEANPNWYLHPSLLSTKHMMAEILNKLNQLDEALEAIKFSVDGYASNPAVTADHPLSLASRWLLAKIMHRKGCSVEALEILRDILEKETNNVSLGYDHPQTQLTRNLIAQIEEESKVKKDAAHISGYDTPILVSLSYKKSSTWDTLGYQPAVRVNDLKETGVRMNANDRGEIA